MPISFEEFSKLEKERKSPRSVSWEEVLRRIIESKVYWSAKEVHEQIVGKKVSRYRVKTMLDKFYRAGKLVRRFDGKRFWYGPRRPKRREKVE